MAKISKKHAYNNSKLPCEGGGHLVLRTTELRLETEKTASENLSGLSGKYMSDQSNRGSNKLV